jgi:hypothetical protein
MKEFSIPGCVSLASKLALRALRIFPQARDQVAHVSFISEKIACSVLRESQNRDDRPVAVPLASEIFHENFLRFALAQIKALSVSAP